MVSRRSFVAGALALLSAPLAAQEKGAPRVVRVGVLDPLPLPANGANLEQLRKGLREAGYAEGKNLALEYRASEGRGSRYREFAAELARMPVDILVTRGTVAALHAKTAMAWAPVKSSCLKCSRSAETSRRTAGSSARAARSASSRSELIAVLRAWPLANCDGSRLR